MNDYNKIHPDIERLSHDLEHLTLDVVEGQQFEKQELYLDGRHWRRCIFTDCSLWVLFGRWRFEDCHFVRSKFMFVDSAGQVAQIAQDLVTQRPRN